MTMEHTGERQMSALLYLGRLGEKARAVPPRISRPIHEGGEVACHAALALSAIDSSIPGLAPAIKEQAYDNCGGKRSRRVSRRMEESGRVDRAFRGVDGTRAANPRGEPVP